MVFCIILKKNPKSVRAFCLKVRKGKGNDNKKKPIDMTGNITINEHY